MNEQYYLRKSIHPKEENIAFEFKGHRSLIEEEVPRLSKEGDRPCRQPVVDILFLSYHNIHKSSCGLCFYASDPFLNEITKIYQLNGLKPKSKGHTNFYECCDLTKKVYLVEICLWDDQFRKRWNSSFGSLG